MHRERKTAIVVGCGIIGLACAHRLLRQGLATTLISPETATQPSSWGNAGHIAVEQAEPLASRKSIGRALRQLGRRGGAIGAPLAEIGAWAPFFLRVARASGDRRFRAGTAALSACMQRALPAWCELLAGIAAPHLLVERGHFVVWESPGSARRGLADWQSASLGPASFRPASYAEAAELEGLISRKISGAIRFEGTAQITDTGQLLASLREAIAMAGGEFLRARVRDIELLQNGRASLVTERGELHAADAIVIAAGVDSGRLLRGTGSKAPIIAERGYHVQGRADAWPARMPPVVFEDRAMVVTRFDSALRATSFVEFARPGRPATESKWRLLERHAAELGLPIATPAHRWMGERPTLPDYLPAIGQSRRAGNLFYAFGHQHLGLTMAAVTGEMIADLVKGRRPAIDEAPFDLERFSRR